MISIDKANSISFFPIVNAMQTFDNTKPHEEYHRSWITQHTATYFMIGHSANIQVLTLQTETITVTGNNGEGISGINPFRTFTYEGKDYTLYQLEITFNNAGQSYIRIENSSGEIAESETIEVIDMNEIEASRCGWLKLQWNGRDSKTTIDWGTGVVMKCWVKGSLLEYTPKIESEIFDNKYETISLQTTMNRQLTFKATELSRQSFEKIAYAMGHKFFYINEVQFVLEDEIEPINHSNEMEISAVLTNRTVIGLNTHTTGLYGSNNIMTIPYTNITTGFTTAALPDGWIVHVIRLHLKSGTNISVWAGSVQASDEDIIYPTQNQDAPVNISNTVHREVDSIDGKTIKFDLSGTNPSVDIYIDLYNGNS